MRPPQRKTFLDAVNWARCLQPVRLVALQPNGSTTLGVDREQGPYQQSDDLNALSRPFAACCVMSQMSRRGFTCGVRNGANGFP
mgnify:CR=1 FL=1